MFLSARFTHRVLVAGLASLSAFLVLAAIATAQQVWGAPRAGVDATSVTGLDPELAQRWEEAKRAAAGEGVTLVLNSGWRSEDQQQRLFDDAVVQYGSREEAARWVLPPELSRHVEGEAIDVGPAPAAAWLGERGSEFGLCRTYANEPWHFEAVTEPGEACPRQLSDSSELVNR